jgi:hypothetical protein
MGENRPNQAFSAEELTGPQLRAARALLGLSISSVAEAAKVGVNTVRRAEDCPTRVTISPRLTREIVSALVQRGVIFIPAGDGAGPGVRLAQGEG